MFARIALAAALAATLTTTAAAARSASEAQTVNQAQYHGVKLGAVAGDFYYTVHRDGFHVTATFAARTDDATPVRFETVLAPNQSVTISTPRAVGEPANSVEITRVSDRVVVHAATPVD
jgi:hypothetical protein